MKKFAIFVAALIALCNARPNEFNLRNVITVPTNCPGNQVLINGQCRDVWRILEMVTRRPLVFPDVMSEDEVQDVPLEPIYNEEIASDSDYWRNVVTVPPNCPSGQEWINGACRDVWALMSEDESNVVVVPPNCPPGTVYINGQCRPIWRLKLEETELEEVSLNSPEKETGNNEFSEVLQDKNIISVPNQCPVGYKADANGICRKIF